MIETANKYTSQRIGCQINVRSMVLRVATTQGFPRLDRKNVHFANCHVISCDLSHV